MNPGLNRRRMRPAPASGRPASSTAAPARPPRARADAPSPGTRPDGLKADLDRSTSPRSPAGASLLPTGRRRSPSGRAGIHPFVYRKMIIGPVGPVRPRDGDMVRVVDRDGLPAGVRTLERPVPDQPPDLGPGGVEAPGPARSGRLGSTAPSPSAATSSSSTSRPMPTGSIHAEADGLSRPDPRPVRRRPVRRGLQPRDLPADRPDPRTRGRTGRHEAFPRPRRRADRPGRGLPRSSPYATPKLPPRVTISENGVRFRVQFQGSHKTGFFCDQRENRLALTKLTPGRTVLDVLLLHRGFRPLRDGHPGRRDSEVTCIDLDEKAIAQAKENANANQVRPNASSTADAFGYMRQMAVNGTDDYGVVVLDPPKLIPGRLDISSGKRKVFRPQRPGPQLRRARRGPCSPARARASFPAEEFVILLRAAARKAGRSVQRPGLHRRVGRPPGRARSPGRGLPQGRLAPGSATGFRTPSMADDPSLDDPGDDEPVDGTRGEKDGHRARPGLLR